MKPTTLEEALSMVPTHWPLTPGVDVWRIGDEYYDDGETGWVGVGSTKGVVTSGYPARRPIPQDVREAVARLVYGVGINQGSDDPDARKFAAWILAGKP